MTLILTLGNREQFIQLSDRRLLSIDKKHLDEEADKSIYFVCANARFLVGFTGLARVGSFDFHKWLMKSLIACAPPDYNIHEIHKRLQQRLTQEFQTIPVIRNLPKSSKRLSVMFSGYIDEHDPPLGTFSILTNYQNFTTGADSPEAWSAFESVYGWERRPWNGEFSLIQRIGMYHAMLPSDTKVLRVFLEELKPAEAIVGKSVEMLRTMADRSQAKTAIGKQISAICLPRDPNKSISTTYHTNVVSHNYFLPSQVRAVGEGDCIAITDVTIHKQALSGEPSPMAVPKVSRNAPCPCRSGKKYKFCHGRKGHR